MIQGPLNKQDQRTKVKDILIHGNWAFSTHSFEILKEIQDIILSHNVTLNDNIEDKVLWNHTSTGTFTTSTMYSCLNNHTMDSVIGKNFFIVWKVEAPNRTKTFLWLLMNG